MHKQAVVFEGQEVAIAVPIDSRLRFIAVRFDVIDLDNRLFDTVTDIKGAIAEHVAANISRRLARSN